MIEFNHIRAIIYSSLDSTHGEPSSLSEDSSSFAPHSSTIKIEFDAAAFENHILAVTYDLDLVNSTDFEDHVLVAEHEELCFDITFEPFIFPRVLESTFEDYLSASFLTNKCQVRWNSDYSF